MIHRIFSTSPLKRLSMTAAAAFMLISSAPAEARGFIPPVDAISFPAVYVTTADGQEYFGHISRYSTRFRGISRITVEDLDGPRLKLKAHEVQQIVVPMNPILEAEMYGEVLTTVEKAIRADYEAIHNVRALILDPIVWPESDRTLLLQRVNPGFDRDIQVYAMFNADEGVHSFDGIPWFGDEEKSYLAVKDDGEPMRIKKRRYKEDFVRLFGDCQTFLDAVPNKQRKFKHFADHVYEYQRACR